KPASQAASKTLDVDGLADEAGRAAVVALEGAELHALVAGAAHHAREAGLALLRSAAGRALAAGAGRDALRAVGLLTAGLLRVVDEDVPASARHAVAAVLVVRVTHEHGDGRAGVGAAGVDVVGEGVHPGPAVGAGAGEAGGGGVPGVIGAGAAGAWRPGL